MLKLSRLRRVTVALLVLAAPPLFAQTEDPSTPATVHFGRFALRPTLALTNLGVDDNVFNESDQANPKRDFTMTVTPATDLWLRLGRAWLKTTIKEDLVYYQRYASERSVNGWYDGSLTVPLNRLILKAGGNYLNTRDRPGFEINARSQRQETGFNGSVEVRAMPKTFFGLRGEQTRVNFDKAAVFLGASLQDELNRTTTHRRAHGTSSIDALDDHHVRCGQGTGSIRVLAPSRLQLDQDRGRRRVRPLRDHQGDGVGGLSQLHAAAVRDARVQGDHRRRQHLVRVPRVHEDRRRDPAGRGGTWYDITQPYYLLTGFNGSLDQHLAGQMDIIGRFGVQQLAYVDGAGVAAALANRTDYVHSYGGGVGYRVARRMRVGFNVDQMHRTSAVSLQAYSGLRFGMSVTYGF